jgi:hypothetical protein
VFGGISGTFPLFSFVLWDFLKFVIVVDAPYPANENREVVSCYFFLICLSVISRRESTSITYILGVLHWNFVCLGLLHCFVGNDLILCVCNTAQKVSEEVHVYLDIEWNILALVPFL